MDMNPFKPLIQHSADFYGKILSVKEPINNFYLKLRLSKANAYSLCTYLTSNNHCKLDYPCGFVYWLFNNRRQQTSSVHVMTTSTPDKSNKKSWFGLGELIGQLLFDFYARY